MSLSEDYRPCRNCGALTDSGACSAECADILQAESERKRPYDITGNIIAYEDGDLNQEEVIELFQHLVDTGLAWSLQGSYGRTAVALIESGEVTR